MPVKQSKNTVKFESVFGKRLKQIREKEKLRAKNRKTTNVTTVKYKNITYYSLKAIERITGICSHSIYKYRKDPRCRRYLRRIPGYYYPFYSYGIMGLFLRMRKTALANNYPTKKRGRKPIKRNYKWYASQKIPNWSKPNTGKKHKINKDVDITKFSF